MNKGIYPVADDDGLSLGGVSIGSGMTGFSHLSGFSNLSNFSALTVREWVIVLH